MTELFGAEHAREIKHSIEKVQSEMSKLASSLSSLTEKIPVSVQKMIDSNERLSTTNTRYAKALCWLTGGLVFVGLLPYLEKLIIFLMQRS